MPSANDDQQVDFVLGEDLPDAGEDLPLGPAPNRPLRIGVLALAGVIVLGGVIARVASSSHTTPTARTSAPTPTESVAPEVLSPTPGVYPHAATYAKICPLDERSRSLCTNDNPLPAEVVAALHAHFPHAHIRASREEELRDIGFGSGMLYYRELHARAGALSVDISVHPLLDTDDESISISATSITRQTLTPGDTVRVRVRAPAGKLPAQHTVAALAADPRLVVDG